MEIGSTDLLNQKLPVHNVDVHGEVLNTTFFGADI